jgi:hypothetical protein
MAADIAVLTVAEVVVSITPDIAVLAVAGVVVLIAVVVAVVLLIKGDPKRAPRAKSAPKPAARPARAQSPTRATRPPAPNAISAEPVPATKVEPPGAKSTDAVAAKVDLPREKEALPPVPTAPPPDSRKQEPAGSSPAPLVPNSSAVQKVGHYWSALPLAGRIAVVAAPVVAILVGVVVAVVPSGGSGGTSTGSGSTGSIDDWVASVCQSGSHGSLAEDPMICNGHPERGGFKTLIFVYQFSSEADMRAHRERWSRPYSYATCTSSDGVAVFVADVSGFGSNSSAVELTAQSLQPLKEFGCTINQAGSAQPSATAQPTTSYQPAPMTPSPPQAGTGSTTGQSPTGGACGGDVNGDGLCPNEQQYVDDLRTYDLKPTRSLREFVDLGWGVCQMLRTKSNADVIDELHQQGNLSRQQLQIIINIAQDRLCHP